MLEKKLNNIVFIEKDERPSRFLVDLKNLNNKNSEKSKNNIIAYFKKFSLKNFFGKDLPGLSKVFFCKTKNLLEEDLAFNKMDNRLTSFLNKKDDGSRRENDLGLLKKIFIWYFSHKEKLNRLAFWPFIKLIFQLIRFLVKIINKTCQKTGQLCIFPFKFFINFLIKLSKISVGEFSFNRNDFFNNPKHNFQKYRQDRNFFAVIKPLTYFALFLFVLILPFKAFTYYKDLSDLRGKVLGISEDAISDVFSASESASQLNFKQASDQFSSASSNFLKAQNEISEISGLLKILAPVIPNKDVKLAANADLILEAGRLSSEMGKLSSEIFNYFSQTDDITIKDLIDDLYLRSQEINRYAQELNTVIVKINPNYIPEEYKDKFILLQNKAGLIAKSINEVTDLIEKSRIFLGLDYDKRYLLVFQNNSELRGSGGFIGSYAQVDFRNGEITDVKAPGGGSYDTEAGLYKRIIAPEPLHLVNPLWHFWDANWWPDWPTTARKLMWFYEESDQSSVDGVIGITPTFVEDMLKIIGPLDMSENYGVIITSDNFWEVVQNFAEQKPEKLMLEADVASSSASSTSVKHEPKKIIGDLIAKIKEELPARLSKDIFLELISTVESNLAGKHILAYLKDNELQKKIEDYDWGGKIEDTEKDYLMVVNTNIAGGKSDKKIEEEIRHESEVFPDGTIINTLKIIRTHTGIKNEQFIGVRNVDWIRVYVPEGSLLIDASGFKEPDAKYFEEPDESWQEDPDLAVWENKGIVDIKSDTKIYNELGKTVFANWSMVDPGESAILTLKYKLPFKIEFQEDSGIVKKLGNIINSDNSKVFPYSLLVQKQPGSIGSKFYSKLLISDNFETSVYYPNNLEKNLHGWQIQDQLLVDKFWAVLVREFD